MIGKVLVVGLFACCIFVSSAFSQKLAEPRLLGTWKLGYEDYGEFIYHRVETFASYLKENPNAKMVARLCSSDKMSLALAGSHGAAFSMPEQAKQLQLPANKILIARWSKCESKTEQYWVVPENSNLEYDEVILAERVQVNRWLVGYSDNRISQPAEREFANNLNAFIAELKSNPKAEGFLIRNYVSRSRNLKVALKRLRDEEIDENRFQILRKQIYSYYPEFMTVSITE